MTPVQFGLLLADFWSNLEDILARGQVIMQFLASLTAAGNPSKFELRRSLPRYQPLPGHDTDFGKSSIFGCLHELVADATISRKTMTQKGTMPMTCGVLFRRTKTVV